MTTLRKLDYAPGARVAIVNRKGGVGKTMVTTNVAGELALRGYNVGIVDADPQGNSALYLGMQKEDGLFKAMVGVQQGEQYERVPLRDVIRVVPTDSYYAPMPEGVVIGGLWLIPSAANTYRIPYLSDDPDFFGDVLSEFVHLCNLDFVLVDTAPTMSMFDGAIYKATDGFIHVTELEIGSLEGLQSSFQQIERYDKRRRSEGKAPGKPLAIIANKMRTLREHVNNMNMVAEAFPGLIAPPMRLLKNYAAATKYGQTVRAFKPNGSEAPEAALMTDFIEGALVRWLAEER